MSLSLQQALDALNGLTSNGRQPTVQELVNLADQVSINVPGKSTTLLYSGVGQVLDNEGKLRDVPNWQVAEMIGLTNPDVATLGRHT